MPRPLETILSLPRVRLVSKVPVVETERLVQLYVDKPRFRPTLIQHATDVARGSYFQFSRDEASLRHVITVVNTNRYVVTRKSRLAMSDLVNDVYGDGVIYKRFDRTIEPLIESSEILWKVSELAESKADSAAEQSLDVARLLGLSIPKSREMHA